MMNKTNKKKKTVPFSSFYPFLNVILLTFHGSFFNDEIYFTLDVIFPLFIKHLYALADGVHFSSCLIIGGGE